MDEIKLTRASRDGKLSGPRPETSEEIMKITKMQAIGLT